MNKDCFTPKVLEADCDNTPITFLTTEIEGVDDTVTPPQNGAHKNTIVKYLMTGHVYLYNSVGIPALMNEGKVDDELSLESANPVQNRVITKALNEEAEARIEADNATNAALQAEQETRAAADTQLGNEIQEETTARENADAGLEAMIDTKVDKENGKGLSTNDYTDADKAIVDGVEPKLNQSVVNNMKVGASTSTDVLVLEDGKVNLWTGETVTQEVPLPVANGTVAGVMNSATYNAVIKNSTDIINILQGTVAINDLPKDPTQEELTEQWKTASGEAELINGARIYDIANTRNWTYYSNVGLWEPLAAGGETVAVNQWTNSAAGIIKGSTEEGQIFAEADGTGSVNGWDVMKSNIANNTSAITTLNESISGKQDSLNATQLSAVNSGITSDLVSKLDGIEDGAQKNVNADWNAIAGAAQILNKPHVGYNANKTVWLGDGGAMQEGGLENTFIGDDAGTFIAGNRNTFVGSAAGGSDPLDISNSVSLGAYSQATRSGEVNVGANGTSYGYSGTSLRVIGGVHDGELDTDVATVGQLKKSQNVYSTTEQVVGTWIDGKPIYRRTFLGNTSSLLIVSGNALNIDELISASGTVKTMDNQYFALPCNNSDSKRASVYMDGGGANNINLIVGSYMNNQPYNVTLEYTKTTG